MKFRNPETEEGVFLLPCQSVALKEIIGQKENRPDEGAA